MEEYLNLISNVGFPIAITLWFMIRTEKVIQANTSVLEKTCTIVEKCQSK